jgi:hypothetical protein
LIDDTQLLLHLLKRGFLENGRNSKTIAVKNGSIIAYVKVDTRRLPLVVHPSNSEIFTQLCALAGVSAETHIVYYHNSTMRAFPDRLNTGKEPTKYGIAFGFDSLDALDLFLDLVLAVDRNSITLDLDNILDGDASPTERLTLIAARIGQGEFRDALIEEFSCRCPITGIAQPELLRASHIKPWSKSNSIERLDSANGLLLAVHIDALFDAGFVTFDQQGCLLKSKQLQFNEWEVFGLVSEKKIDVDPKRAAFLEYHHAHVFQK